MLKLLKTIIVSVITVMPYNCISCEYELVLLLVVKINVFYIK